VSVVDLSIIAFQMIAPYDARFDLNRDGSVGLPDLSIFFGRMKQPN
jgi:hypothetical protein